MDLPLSTFLEEAMNHLISGLKIACGIEPLPPILEWIPFLIRILAFLTFLPVGILATADAGGYIIFRAIYQPFGSRRTMFYKEFLSSEPKEKILVDGTEKIDNNNEICTSSPEDSCPTSASASLEASPELHPVRMSPEGTLNNSQEPWIPIKGFPISYPETDATRHGYHGSNETNKIGNDQDVVPEPQSPKSSTLSFSTSTSTSISSSILFPSTNLSLRNVNSNRSNPSKNAAISKVHSGYRHRKKQSSSSSSNEIQQNHRRNKIRRKSSFSRARAYNVGVDGPLGFEALQSPFATPAVSPLPTPPMTPSIKSAPFSFASSSPNSRSYVNLTPLTTLEDKNFALGLNLETARRRRTPVA